VPYFVAENRLIRLALDGSRITGALADDYVLDKLAATITDTRWQLVELNGRPVPNLERLPWLTFGSADSRVSGFGGCNGLTGAYEIDPAAARIRFGKIASTMMACAAGMDVETELHRVLGTVDNYSLAGDRMTLNRARMAPLARFEAVYLF
jgi:heat shock protein HslJ